MNVARHFSYEPSVALQSRGALLAFDYGTEQFAWGSENAHKWVGHYAFNSLAGSTAFQIFEHSLTHAQRNANSHPLDLGKRDRLGVFTIADRTCEAWMFRTEKHFVVELTRCPDGPEPMGFTTLGDVQTLNRRLKVNHDATALTDCAAVLRTLSGYNCVAVLRNDGSDGIPLATAGEPLAMALPWAVDALLHEVEDLNAPVLTLGGADVSPGSLAASGLIAPRRDHVMQIADKITATATMGFGGNEAPTAYIAFFHRTPRLLNTRTRLALQHLSLLLDHRGP